MHVLKCPICHKHPSVHREGEGVCGGVVCDRTESEVLYLLLECQQYVYVNGELPRSSTTSDGE